MSNTKDAADFLVETCEVAGVAQMTVSDGTLFMFKKSFIEHLIANNPDSDKARDLRAERAATGRAELTERNVRATT